MKGALALFGFALIIVLCVQETYGETLEFDPLKRNLIVVEGEASLSVPINEFRISFTFDIEKGSFDEARIESKRISERIGKSESYDYSYSFTQEYAKPVFSKGFKVKGQIVDHIYITANVIGIYEIE